MWQQVAEETKVKSAHFQPIAELAYRVGIVLRPMHCWLHDREDDELADSCTIGGQSRTLSVNHYVEKIKNRPNQTREIVSPEAGVGNNIDYKTIKVIMKKVLYAYPCCLYLAVVAVALLGCNRPLIVPDPTPSPVATPEEGVIVITPEIEPNPDATYYLRVTVTDENGQALPATLIVQWPDTGGALEMGPTSEQIIPIPADGSLFIVKARAPGYYEAEQKFRVTLSEDESEPYAFRLLPLGVEG